MPQRIQRKREKGWRMPANAVFVGRPTIYGNPFKVGYCSNGYAMQFWTNKDVVQLYEQELDVMLVNRGMTREEFLRPLRGKDLVCWCPPDQPCHADVLLRLANEEPEMSDETDIEPLLEDDGMSRIKCPICDWDWWAVNRVEDVCAFHQDWIVSVCQICHEPCFTNHRGICPNCERMRLYAEMRMTREQQSLALPAFLLLHKEKQDGN